MSPAPYWWLRPHVVAIAVWLPMLVVAALLPESWYAHASSSIKVIDAPAVAAGAFALAAFSLGSLIGMRAVWSPGTPAHALPRVDRAVYDCVFFGLFALMLAAFVLWFHRFALNPRLLLPLWRAEPGAILLVKAMAARYPGITTMAHLGAVVVVLGALRPYLTGGRHTPASLAIIALTLALGLAQVFLHSERRALILLLVPLAVVIIRFDPRYRRWLAALPLLGALALVFFFAVTEQVRSWASVYSKTEDSLVEFAATRLGIYYMTALNNGAGIYRLAEPGYAPNLTAKSLYRLSQLGVQGAGSRSGALERDTKAGFLNSFGNPEFSNSSAVYAPLADFGTVGGLVAWGAIGVLSGTLLGLFLAGRLSGLLLFPGWYVGVLELGRVFYWGGPAYFVVGGASLAALGVLAVASRRTRPDLGTTPVSGSHHA